MDPAGRVEAVGGLVQHQQVRGVHQGARQREPLPVTERQPPGAAVGVRAETESPDHLVDRSGRRRG